MALPNTPPPGAPPGMAGGPPMGGPPMGGPPMGGAPMGGGEDITVEDLLEALKQLPRELLQQLVTELQAFLSAGPEAGAPPPPGPPGPPGLAGGGPSPGLGEAAKARASI